MIPQFMGIIMMGWREGGRDVKQMIEGVDVIDVNKVGSHSLIIEMYGLALLEGLNSIIHVPQRSTWYVDEGFISELSL